MTFNPRFFPGRDGDLNHLYVFRVCLALNNKPQERSEARCEGTLRLQQDKFNNTVPRRQSFFNKRRTVSVGRQYPLWRPRPTQVGSDTLSSRIPPNKGGHTFQIQNELIPQGVFERCEGGFLRAALEASTRAALVAPRAPLSPRPNHTVGGKYLPLA